MLEAPDEMTTVCRLDEELTLMFAENPPPETRALSWPPAAEPLSVPLSERVVSLHEPDMLDPFAMTSLTTSKR